MQSERINVYLKILLLLVVLHVCNCASLRYTFSDSHEGQKADKIYIGLRADLTDIDRGLSSGGGHGGIGILGTIISMFDLPLSTVSDTIFLPYTIPYYYVNREKLYLRAEILEIYLSTIKGKPGSEGRLYYAGSTPFRHHFKTKSGELWRELICDVNEVRLPLGVEYTRIDFQEKLIAIDPENAFRPQSE